MIKISLIVVIGLAGTAMLRRRSAALRHWVLALAIVCAAATPVLELVMPAWQLPAATQWIRGKPLALYIPIVERDWHEDVEAVQSAAASQAVDNRPWLMRLWFVGIAFNVAIFGIGFARLAWLGSRSRKVESGAWTASADAISRAYGSRRPVVLLQSSLYASRNLRVRRLSAGGVIFEPHESLGPQLPDDVGDVIVAFMR